MSLFKLGSLIIVILFLVVLGCGCIELGQQTRGAGNALAGSEIIEHTYLWGNDGPFTKIYDLRIWVLGVDVINLKGISQAQLDAAISKFNSENQNKPPTTQLTPKPTTPTTSRSKNVAITVQKSGNQILAVYQGGSDTNLLNSITVRILSSTGTEHNYNYESPYIGQQFIMNGFSGTNHVIIMGFFRDGTQQIMIDTYV